MPSSGETFKSVMRALGLVAVGTPRLVILWVLVLCCVASLFFSPDCKRGNRKNASHARLTQKTKKNVLL